MTQVAPGVFDDDFLLETAVARELYHEHAAREPILDYHCHLSPEQVASDYEFSTLTELWLAGDHYKWRAMRANGIGEELCTGAASDWEKFEAWARTVPYTLRNPLFHWTHLELKNPFGIRRYLDAGSAREIYDVANRRLAEGDLTTRGLLRHFDVRVVCTTDDPVDNLEAHARYAATAAASATRMLPTWRPDRALAVDDPAALHPWLDRLGQSSGIELDSYEALLTALDVRHAFFHAQGCRLSDHGLETLWSEDAPLAQVRATFLKARRGERATPEETAGYRSALLHELALMDHSRCWVQQFHLGALRDNNTRLRASVGSDAGCDSVGDREVARPLARFLDRLDAGNRLTRTILYNLNPRDNEVFASMIGSFQDGSTAGKLQYGSAWWFLDQLDGMKKQLNALSNLGLLARFVGMVTDSRSFLSYSRHEYFRRLFCNLLGEDVRRGLVPNDTRWLGELVRDVCFRNARDYFGFARSP